MSEAPEQYAVKQDEALARAAELIEANRRTREEQCQRLITQALQQMNCTMRAEVTAGGMVIPVPITIVAR